MSKKIIQILNIIMFCGSIILGTVIFVEKIYSSKLTKLTDALTSFITLNKNKSKEVSTNIKYVSIGEFCYVSGDNNIYCPTKGIVIKKTEKSVIIKSNNAYFHFDNIESITVNLLDQLNKDDVIGMYLDNFTFYVSNQGKIISYEEYISNNG